MTRSRFTPSVLLFSLACLASLLHAQSVPAGRTLWKGTSGNYNIEWSTGNLRVVRSDTGATVFDAAARAKSEWNDILRRANRGPLEADFTYRLLSVAGPYLSMEEGEYCECGGAHPTAIKRFRAIDLSRSSTAPAAASLTAVFPERDVLAALLADTVVRKALESEKKPASLAALVDTLQDEIVKQGDCEYTFPKDLLESFAFYDSVGDKALVRLSLPYAAEICRGQMIQLGLTLQSPESAKAWLADAKSGHGGLLMVDSKKISPSATTSVHFARK